MELSKIERYRQESLDLSGFKRLLVAGKAEPQLRYAIILLPFPFPLSIVFFPLLPLPFLPLNLLNPFLT